MKNQFAETVRILMKQNGWTMKELGQRVGRSESTVSYWLSGKVVPPMGIVQKLADLFQVTTDEMIYGLTDAQAYGLVKSAIPKNIIPVPTTKKIPMLGSIACGEPVYADQEYGWVETDLKADFCLRASGDSMIGARIHDGDLVYCREQEEVHNGEIAVVIIDDEATLKRFYQYGDTIVLRPENPAYQEQVYSGEKLNEIRVLGKAIAFRAPII